MDWAEQDVEKTREAQLGATRRAEQAEQVAKGTDSQSDAGIANEELIAAQTELDQSRTAAQEVLDPGLIVASGKSERQTPLCHPQGKFLTWLVSANALLLIFVIPITLLGLLIILISKGTLTKGR
jgi:ABC-type Na+ efflux pump permease subunit